MIAACKVLGCFIARPEYRKRVTVSSILMPRSSQIGVGLRDDRGAQPPSAAGFSDLGDDGVPGKRFWLSGVGCRRSRRSPYPSAVCLSDHRITRSPDHPILSSAFLRVLCGELLVSRR